MTHWDRFAGLVDGKLEALDVVVSVFSVRRLFRTELGRRREVRRTPSSALLSARLATLLEFLAIESELALEAGLADVSWPNLQLLRTGLAFG